LVDKSLVLAEPQGDALRYRLLESTRAYALEKLDAARERDLTTGRHLRYLRDHFAELWERRERTARRADLEAALQNELEDVRAALDGALAPSNVIDGGALLANIGSVWGGIGLEAEGMARCEAYLAALPADQSWLHARISTALSTLLAGCCQEVRAFELATQAVEHARASGEAASLVCALHQCAMVAVFLHRFDDAEQALVQAEAIPETSVKDRTALFATRAHFSFARSDFETAARMFQQLRKEERSLGNTSAEQSMALNLAEVEYMRGQTQQAIAIIHEMLPAMRSGAVKDQLALPLLNLAGYLAAVDDLSGATAAAREAIAIRAAREPGHAYIAGAIEPLALVFALRGDHARAATLQSYAEAAFQRHGSRRTLTDRRTHDRLTALLNDALTPDEFARLSAEGAALTPEAAIALALAGDEPT
jgi:hypothetical protein